MKTTRSEKLFKEACELIPGGVNSPVRACLGVGADPLFIASAKGSHVITVDGQEMIDFVESWGPMLLGHSHPEVTKAVVEAAGKGTSYGAPCPAEVELARMVVDAFPGMDMVRMVNSGTEATMSALRLARGVTGRTKVLKFIGCYHGHADPFLASAGSGVATLSIRDYDLGYTTGEMAVKILNGEADISTMPIEYTDVTKKYNKAICDDLGLTVPEGYEEIEA